MFLFLKVVAVHRQISHHVGVWYFWVVNSDSSAFFQQKLANRDGRALSSISGILLKSEPINNNLLVSDSIKQTTDYVFNKSFPLVIVQLDDLMPISGDFWQVQALSQIQGGFIKISFVDLEWFTMTVLTLQCFL